MSDPSAPGHHAHADGDTGGPAVAEPDARCRSCGASIGGAREDSDCSACGTPVLNSVLAGVTATGVVEAEQAVCLTCGYTIHGLAAAGACPECGTALLDSLRGRLLRYSNRDYVRTVHRGVLTILICSILAFVAELGGGIVGVGVGIAGARGGFAPAPVVTTMPAGSPAAIDRGVGTAPIPAESPDGVLPPPVPSAPAEDSGDQVDPEDADGSEGVDTDGIVITTPEGARTPPPTTTTRIAPGSIASVTVTDPTPAGPNRQPLWLRMLFTAATIIGATLELLVLLGWWWFSSPDPALPESERGDGPRRVIRTVVILVGLSTVLNLGIANVAAFSGVSFSPGFIGLMGFTLLAELSKIARFFAAMLYLRWMAPRIPDTIVERRSRTYIWLLPVIAVVGVCVVVGPLVASIMQWLLLFRVRGELKGILDTMTPSGPGFTPATAPGLGAS